MNEGRFYTVVMCVLLVAIVLILLLFNWLQQPEGLDRALLTMILTFVGPTVAVILNNMANSKQAQKLHEGQEQIKQELQQAPEQVRQAANAAKEKLEFAALVAAKAITDTAKAREHRSNL